jgi:hypothetical protein
MTALTSFERSLKRTLIDHARRADPDKPHDARLSYGELGLELDPEGLSTYPMTRPPFRGLNEALGHVVRHEVEHGRPLLTALVVTKDTGSPGPGFAGLARELGLTVTHDDEFAQQELERVVHFWAEGDIVSVIDAATDRILAKIHELERRLP